MIRIEVENEEVATIYGPFSMEFLKLISRLSGRKAYHGSKTIKFEASGSNIKILKDSGFEIEWQDKTGALREFYELERLATQHDLGKEIDTTYTPAVPYLKHMEHCLGISWNRKAYALLLEMGLCKTSICIHNFGILFKRGEITAVMIYAPKGVHRQWIMEQIPEHLDKSIKVNLILWNKETEYERSDLLIPGRLNIFAFNIDSVRTEKGQEVAARFVRLHEGKIFIVVDESHEIKNYGSARTREIMKIGIHCKYRRIMTGTPISKSLRDMWSQFMFLDPRFIGINYQTVFERRFCEMGGFKHKDVVGSTNIEEFYTLIAPHSYRLTKAEATDLPPKIYSKREYEMDTKTRSKYDDLKHTFMLKLESGDIIDAKTQMDFVIKAQQLLSGFIVLDPKTHELERVSDQRLGIVADMLEQIKGQVIIWHSFIPDRTLLREMILKRFGEEAAGLDDIELYKSKKKRFAVLNPASGGTGLNLQFKTPGDNNAIYYNSTNRSIHRWQSEDRIWRTGMGGNAWIWDIICHKTVDQKILDNLKENKDLADLVLDDIRQMLSGG